jgi:hypothetical protein
MCRMPWRETTPMHQRTLFIGAMCVALSPESARCPRRCARADGVVNAACVAERATQDNSKSRHRNVFTNRYAKRPAHCGPPSPTTIQAASRPGAPSTTNGMSLPASFRPMQKTGIAAAHAMAFLRSAFPSFTIVPPLIVGSAVPRTARASCVARQIFRHGLRRLSE